MKAARQNNPVVIGILLCILVYAGNGIIADLRGSDLPTVKLARVNAPAATPQAHKLRTVPVERSRRNPFSRPAAYRLAPPTLPGVRTGKVPSAPLLPPFRVGLPPLAARPLRAGGTAETDTKADGRIMQNTEPAQSEKSESQGTPTLAQQESDLAAHLTLTAIVGGKQPCALLATSETDSQLLCVGERLHTLRLVAVHAEEVVLAGETGIWTLPLTTGHDLPPAPSLKGRGEPAPAFDPPPSQRGTSDSGKGAGGLGLKDNADAPK